MKVVKYWNRGCGLSIFGGVKALSHHGPEQPDPLTPPLSRGLH